MNDFFTGTCMPVQVPKRVIIHSFKYLIFSSVYLYLLINYSQFSSYESLQVNRLNDSHAQLMVHWLGEGTDVIICLAREPPLGILDDPKKAPPPSPSSVFLSFDYGDTFQDKSDLFNLTINGTSIRSTVDEFITHLKFNTVSETDDI